MKLIYPIWLVIKARANDNMSSQFATYKYNNSSISRKNKIDLSNEQKIDVKFILL